VSLRLEGVRKSYPEFTIRLDLEARAGQMLTLLGPSGCGKTTSLRLVAGFLQPEAGRIFIGGQAVQGEPPHRRRIGIVFQDYALFPNLNVLDNVCFGPAVQGWERAQARARGRELLEMVHLSGYERRPRARACCCWTSRCRRWTLAYGAACVWKSRRCSASWG
jgi:ABC-type Fe3+/spermidine/putrescine transport system ATPase subunit